MRGENCFGVLVVVLLMAGGCGVEPISEPPPPVDGAMVPAGSAQVVRPSVDTPMPSVPVEAGVAAAADPVPAAVLPIVGPGGGIVVDQEGNAIDHGPMGTPPEIRELRQLEMEESLRKATEIGPGTGPDTAPQGVFLPGGL